MLLVSSGVTHEKDCQDNTVRYDNCFLKNSISITELRTLWQATGYQISKLPSVPDPWAGERTYLFGQSFTPSVIARPPDQVRGHACSGNPSYPLSLPDLFGQSRKRTGFSAHPSLDQKI